MSVFDDVSQLKSHYTLRRDWYLAAIERLDGDIQKTWNDYFLMKNQQFVNNFKVAEVGATFNTLRTAVDYFRQQLQYTEKRLDELSQQEYALLSKGPTPPN